MGEGIHFYIRDELWDHAAMRVHMERYHPIGRMFADRYCRTDDRVIFPPAEGPKTRYRRRMGGAERYPSIPIAMCMGIASLHPSYEIPAPAGARAGRSGSGAPPAARAPAAPSRGTG